MQGRTNNEAIDERSQSDTEQAVVWCGKCGIPYAAATAYCSLCGSPLAEASDPFAAKSSAPRMLAAEDTPRDQVTPAVTPTPLADEQSALAAAKIEAQLPPMPALPSAPSGGLIGRMRQRQQAMSDDEVDAAAAAIIARARAEEDLIGSDPQAREVLEHSPAYLPDPKLEAALIKRQERDRAWLIAGFVCCIVLILFALVISRYTSTGLLSR